MVHSLSWSGFVNPELEDLWEEFKIKYNKKYNSDNEIVRREIWERNIETINKHNLLYNLGKYKYTLGINQFADITHEEFKKIYLYNGLIGKVSKNDSNVFKEYDNDIPDEVNWVKKGYVTHVKNQGQCGSCWAFSTTGSMEGQQFRKTKKLLSLSEQQLVDCSSKYGNMGCDGGLMDYAFKYIMRFGLEKENSYPYTAQNGECQYSKRKVVSKCRGYRDVESGNEIALANAVAKIGPISVGIDASNPSFQLYRGGVYDEENCSSTRLDHGVLAAGYGVDEDSGENYWLVKNSWGDSWGINGYIKMSKDKDNQCGIATQASYPIM